MLELIAVLQQQSRGRDIDPSAARSFHLGSFRRGAVDSAVLLHAHLRVQIPLIKMASEIVHIENVGYPFVLLTSQGGL
jgi:hypothetical protein